MTKRLAVLMLVFLMCMAPMTACKKDEPTPDPAPTVQNDPQPAQPDPAPDPDPEPEASAMPLIMMTYSSFWSDNASPRYYYGSCYLPSAEAGTAKTYPGLADALKRIARDEKKRAEQADRDLFDQAVEDDEAGAPEGLPLCYEQNISVERADEQAVSLIISEYWNLGGVHPSTFSRVWNIDPKTGKDIPLSEVVKDLDAFKGAVTERLKKEYGSAIEEGPLEAISPESYKWILGLEGITVMFDPYEIAPYAAGSPAVRFSFDGPDSIVFTGNYTSRTENVVVDFSPNEDFKFGGDTYRVEPVFNEDLYIESVEIRFNGRSLTDTDVGGYDVQPALFVTAEGDRYIYMQAGFENDNAGIFVYSVGLDGVKRVDYTNCNRHGPWGAGEESAVMCMTTPECFSLGKRVDGLGTYGVAARHTVGPDGMPLMLDKYYSLPDGGVTVTLAQDITLPEVDESGEPTGKDIELKTGYTLTGIRTDGEYITDVRTEDGKLCRVELTHDGDFWPLLLNGTPIFEVFDDLLFAG